MIRLIATITIAVLLGLSSLASAADRKVIIGFRKATGASDEGKRQKFYRSGGQIKRSHKIINAISGQLPENEIEKLKKDPDVAYVEPDVVVGVSEPALTLAPLTQEYTDSWGVTRIGGNSAAAAGFTGAGIKVAVLDSGIDYSHPDLIDNYKGGYNFVYENDDPYDDGYISHGTHIAGIIGARNNGTGVVGVAPEVSLYAVKVLGGMVMGDLSDILAGIEWAISNNMNVINLSIGSPQDSTAFKDACDRARQAGIIVVAASGNANSSVVDFPAAYESVIAVSATNIDDTRASFSNYGSEVELAAPGMDIKSTLRGGGYGTMRGTSQATAHVSGAAAILLAKAIADGNTGINAAEGVRTRLGASAEDLGDPGRDPYFGFGIVDLGKALTPPPPSTYHYTIVRNGGPPKSQLLKVPLKPGAYTVEIMYNGNIELKVAVLDSKGLDNIETDKKKHRNHAKVKHAPRKVQFDINIGDSGSLLFLPAGKPGSTADITITAAAS